MANRDVTARIQPRKQDLEDAYAPPANFLELDVLNPETHGVGNKRYTDYELRMRVTPTTLSLCAIRPRLRYESPTGLVAAHFDVGTCRYSHMTNHSKPVIVIIVIIIHWRKLGRKNGHPVPIYISLYL